ncbi:hypothetical protein C0993_001058 [Termitomyces sp. T159_Od127]|nr:hypothetical protein C0993_001058 [Termitomyces sp. T159_Od127]
MAKNLFSVPIFFIVFRETLEAAIIVSVLLGLVEQIVHGDPSISSAVQRTITAEAESKNGSDNGSDPEDDRAQRRLLIRKLRIQAIFSTSSVRIRMEAVVFVGGVSLGQSATSTPIAAIVGIICGLTCGFLIYQFASRSTLSVFLVVMTNFILLIGAGLFSKAVGAFEQHAFNTLLGADVDDAGGTGPGSYRVQGNGRTKLFGLESAAAVRRLDARRTREREEKIEEEENQQNSRDITTLPR